MVDDSSPESYETAVNSVGGSSRCDTEGCHRSSVLIHEFTDAQGDHRVNAMCLPCYRVLDRAKEVPLGDESAEWTDVEAYYEYRKEVDAS